MTMHTRPLGRTTLKVSQLGLGLAALGRPGYINLGHADDLDHTYDPAAMQAHAFAVLDAARALGVCYFDAARSYGAAESFLGAWLNARGIAPGEFVVGSKWGYTYTAGWQIEAERHEVKDHSLTVLLRQTAETRSHLGAHLNLYQIHSATLESGVLDNLEVLRALRNLREEGWAIGLSLSGPRQGDVLRRAMEVRIDGHRLFDAVQATWNLLERSAGPMLAEAHASGMGVIVKEALANGRLTDRNEDLAFGPSREVLERLASRTGVGIDAVALAGVLAQPWADVVLSGAATVEQVRSNARALDVAWDEAMAGEAAGLVEPAEVYWQRRGRLAWN